MATNLNYVEDVNTETNPNYELFSRSSRAIIFNLQTAAVQRMLDFDYACRRETPSVAAIVYSSRPGYHKCFWGSKEIIIPIYRSIEDAAKEHPDADVLINFASFRSAYKPSLEALQQPTIRTVSIIAEGIPERKTKELLAYAEANNKCLIGPATVGGIKAGCFKIGNTAGSLDNILERKLYVPGFVGFVSKSGGMSNEMYNILSLSCGPKNDEGTFYPALNEGIAIGGDRYPGSTLFDHLMRFQANPDIKMLVALGEVGGEGEYQIAEAIKNGTITKPLVIWVMGTCTKLFPGEVQFGHAGACADAERETAHAKNDALREAGAIVPSSYDELGEVIHEVYAELYERGEVKDIEVPEPVNIPLDLKDAEKKGLIRRSTSFISTISDDRGEELTYNGIKISDVITNNYGIGGTIGLLWFRKTLPEAASKFLDMVLVLVADHGPAVSGAHNAIVSARAGKDLVSSLASGLLTVGPRFGGAIDGAAHYFKEAVDKGIDPEDFVTNMKKKGVPIPGIGHRVKSLDNPDLRVHLLKEYTKNNFGECRYLNYAIEVEQLTTKKKANLILNVDGAIGVSFVDMLYASGMFREEEIHKTIELGFLNGLFIIGRSIGIIGHVMDQKRLSETLYRHPWDDIQYMDPNDPRSS